MVRKIGTTLAGLEAPEGFADASDDQVNDWTDNEEYDEDD
jgi:hypothetical protein